MRFELTHRAMSLACNVARSRLLFVSPRKPVKRSITRRPQRFSISCRNLGVNARSIGLSWFELPPPVRTHARAQMGKGQCDIAALPVELICK